MLKTIGMLRAWGAALTLFGAAAAAQGAIMSSCVPDPTGGFTERCTFTRDLDLWFGTLSVVGAPLASQSFLELSDLISAGLRSHIQVDPVVDARVVSDIPAWVRPFQTNVEWVVGIPILPDNFPAQQNLLNDYAAAASALDAMVGPGSLTFAAASAATDRNYLLDSFVTTSINTVNDFVAQAHYFAQNATYTVAATPVPEPQTYALFGVGLLALWLQGRKRAKPR